MDVAGWMSRDVETIDSKELLSTAREKMTARRCRHLPVVDASGLLIGIVTERDLREYSTYLAQARVSSAMVEPVITVAEDASLESAADLIIEHGIGALPVVAKDGKMVGILTRTDLLCGLLQMLHGGGEASARIDLGFTSSQQTLSEAVRVVEAAGGSVVALGALRHTADMADKSIFYLRVKREDAQRLADSLKRAGYEVGAVRST